MGVLEALEEEERALKAKVKERAQAAVAAGYERRTLLETKKAQRPTSCTQKSFQPASSQKRQETAEDSEESQAKWAAFQHKNDMFQKNRERYLADQRKKKEQQEVADCTFKPQNPKGRRASSHVRIAGGTMFDRARHMEAKKQERMNQIRQELAEKEMSQCSFHPATIDRSGFERGYDPCSRLQCASNRPPTASRPRAGPSHPSHGARRPRGQYSSSMGCPALARNGYGGRSAEESSEASGTYDEMSSYDGDASDVTALHPGVCHAAEAGYIDVPQGRMSGDVHDEDSTDLVLLQRLHERRRLLEETLSPDPASVNNFEFAEVLCDQETAPGIPEKLRSAPAAAVAEAVHRMEALLLGGSCDFSDEEESDEDSVDDGEDETSQSNDWHTSANALGGKLGSASGPRPPASPSRGGG